MIQDGTSAGPNGDWIPPADRQANNDILGPNTTGSEMPPSICRLLCAVAFFFLVEVLILAPALALEQEDVARCTSKDNVAPKIRVSSCTELIDAGVVSGKLLAALFNNRGLAYHMGRDYARSIADFDEAIRLDPTSDSAFLNRARSYVLQKKYDLALADYDKAIELDPKNAGAYMNRGNVHHERGDTERAIADYGAAIQIRPADPKAFHNRCGVLLEIGQAEAAFADCNEALRLSPDYTPAFLLRGDANFALARFEQAAADYGAFLRQNPRNAWALYGRGMAKMKTGDEAGGTADIQAAKALSADIEQDFADYFRPK
jgi:tetratricopeptide (TPR) repeat protein